MTALVVLAVGVAWLAYCYAIYPLVVRTIAEWRRPMHVPDDTLRPTVALVISAYNEGRGIRAKLQNALALEYPANRFSIWVSSDGSRDETNTIAGEYQATDPRVKLIDYPTNRGKTAALMDTLTRLPAETDIVVFSDGNSLYRPDAILRLVRHFGDSRVGCVAGELLYRSPGGESTYRSYENALRQAESRLGVTVGAEGSIFAARRSLVPRIDTSLIEDLTIPLTIQSNGYRVVYAADAISEEEFDLSWQQQYRRRRRIVNRSFRSARTIPTVWNPLTGGLAAIAFLSHRVLRWLSAIPFVVSLVASVALLWSGYPLRILGVAAMLFIGWIAIGWLLRNAAKPMPGARTAFFFASANLAMLLGVVSALRGERVVSWAPARPGEG